MINRIMITGPESTGKSSLAQKLAAHYQTVWVPERARTYLEEIGRPYRESDLLEIAREQVALEDSLARKANNYLFCDTGMLVLKIWSEHAYKHCHPWILEQLQKRNYYHYLVPNIELPWEPDPQREHPELRAYFFALYQKQLELYQKPYSLVAGLGAQRCLNAIRIIDSLDS
jgi:NadR type nicotinamide-nucleotide adenylyltransferase